MRTQYQEMTIEELMQTESELRTSIFNLRLGNTTKELENTARIKDTRRELARCMTAQSASRKASEALAASE